MGGGGGGGGLTPEQIQRLEERAKKSLKDGSGGKRNVFISFASDDLDEVELLREQAKNENNEIEFNDLSLKKPFDSEQADYIKRGIRERIRQASVTIVYLSNKTASSKWVNWEIRESISMGKGIVAMHKSASPPKNLPKAIQDNNIQVVPWNQKQLAKAIKSKSKYR